MSKTPVQIAVGEELIDLPPRMPPKAVTAIATKINLLPALYRRRAIAKLIREVSRAQNGA
jgi:hypothetical protein